MIYDDNNFICKTDLNIDNINVGSDCVFFKNEICTYNSICVNKHCRERDLIRRLDFCFSECGYRNNCAAFNKVTKEKMENNKKLFSRL